MSRIRLVGLIRGTWHAHSGRYVVSYDPDYHLPDGDYDGGRLVTSNHRNDAAEFPTMREALALWRSGPSCDCHRKRADGEPNRPLTAFDVEILP